MLYKHNRIMTEKPRKIKGFAFILNIISYQDGNIDPCTCKNILLLAMYAVR